MARIEVDGIGIEYEILGPDSGPAVAITPGGRFSKNVAGIPQLGEALAAQGVRTLLWDRPNCGASDLHFEGSSESGMQAKVLVGLIRALKLGPTTLVAGSAGARISLFAAREDPEVVSGLVLCWISGGLISMMRLGSYYCCEAAEVAALRGMAAVAEMPIWAEQLALNPGNRERMLAMPERDFIAVMERWAAGYIPSPASPVGGITKEDFAKMTMRAMILRGSPRDIYHPAWVCEEVASLLPNATLAEPPWPIDVFAERMRDGKGLFHDFPMLAPQIVEFVGQQAQE